MTPSGYGPIPSERVVGFVAWARNRNRSATPSQTDSILVVTRSPHVGKRHNRARHSVGSVALTVGILVLGGCSDGSSSSDGHALDTHHGPWRTVQRGYVVDRAGRETWRLERAVGVKGYTCYRVDGHETCGPKPDFFHEGDPVTGGIAELPGSGRVLYAGVAPGIRDGVVRFADGSETTVRTAHGTLAYLVPEGQRAVSFGTRVQELTIHCSLVTAAMTGRFNCSGDGPAPTP